MNKLLIRTIAFLICLLFLTVAVDAQKRRTTRRATKPAPVRTTPAPSPAEVKAGAEKVSIQLKNVTRFIYVLGGVARGIEDADKEAKTGRLPKAVVDKNTQFKQSVIQSIRNLRAGLAALEVEFRTTPALKSFVGEIQGITDLSGRSEDLALAGQFNESGKVLLLIVERLSDTLAAMP